ncbi:MAG TPA: hypothetical protein VGL77_03765 [Armatimonadota bacterium]
MFVRVIVRFAIPLLLVMLCCPVQAGRVRVMVSAYHSNHRTATGTRPHARTCAGPRKWLGCYVKIPGMGTYKVTDTCRRGLDLWLPSRQACHRFGRRRLLVSVERPGARHAARRAHHVTRKPRAVHKPRVLHVKHSVTRKHHAPPPHARKKHRRTR